MFGFIKTTLVGAAVAATALTAAAPANAQDWHRHHGYHHHRGNAGDIVAAGIIGAAAGAVLGSVLAPPAPVYVDPYPRYRSYPSYSTYYRSAPTYYRSAPRVVYVQPAAQPWTRAWYNDCAARYRSFDPGSGTYLGYDGARHFCDLN